MDKETAQLKETLRITQNNYKFQSELNRILRTQVEPELYNKAVEQAKTICRDRFIKST